MGRSVLVVVEHRFSVSSAGGSVPGSGGEATGLAADGEIGLVSSSVRG